MGAQAALIAARRVVTLELSDRHMRLAWPPPQCSTNSQTPDLGMNTSLGRMTLEPLYNKVFVGKRVVEPDIIGIWQKGDDHPLTVPTRARLNETKMPDKEVISGNAPQPRGPACRCRELTGLGV